MGQMTEAPIERRRVFTDAEVAEVLRVPVRRVQELCRRGTLAHHRIGRAYRITASQLDAYLSGSETAR